MKTKIKKKSLTDKQLNNFIINELYKLGVKLEKMRPNDAHYCAYLLFCICGSLFSSMTCKKHFKQVITEIFKKNYE